MTSERRKLLRTYRNMIRKAAHAPKGLKKSRLTALRGWVHRQMKREIDNAR